jgi:hypothetical protein
MSLTSLREKLIKIGAKVDGRSRSLAADVRRHPSADRSAAGTARPRMRSGEVKVQRARENCTHTRSLEIVLSLTW